MSRLFLITGKPGCGKTTLVQRLSEKWGRERCCGFYTLERREGRIRSGFMWRTFDGQSGVLADLQSGQPRVGKYRVHLESFERMLTQLRNIPTTCALLIDEVGKMECLSEKFKAVLPIWEKTDVLRIFTVAKYGTPFIEDFKSRNQQYISELTPSNREEIFDHLVTTL
jgi:nucleoside-triphosphatase